MCNFLIFTTYTYCLNRGMVSLSDKQYVTGSRHQVASRFLYHLFTIMFSFLLDMYAVEIV